MFEITRADVEAVWETEKFVVVALVTERFAMVEEACARRPPAKVRRVEVLLLGKRYPKFA
mgnify:CR=1 FL=1